MNHRILFVTCQNGEPITAHELIDGEWIYADLSEYFTVEHDLILLPDNESPTGYAWTSEDVDFIVDAMEDPGQPPRPETAQMVFDDLVYAFIADEDHIEGLDDVPNAVVFCVEESHLTAA